MKTLYFVAGFASDKQKELAKKAFANIRNSLIYQKGESLENCDEVMGDIPAEYAEKFKVSSHDKATKQLLKPVKPKAPAKPKAPVKDETPAKDETGETEK